MFLINLWIPILTEHQTELDLSGKSILIANIDTLPQHNGHNGIKIHHKYALSSSCQAFCPKQCTTSQHKTVQYLFHAQQSFPVVDIATYTQHLLYSISTNFLFLKPTEMGAILSKHIDQAQPVIIEDDNTDNFDYDDNPIHFQILSRINIPIVTLEPEDE